MFDAVQNIWLLAAGAASGATLLIHIFAGGPTVARPLLSSDMEEVAKLTNYYCWHLVTITLAAMTVGFIYPAFTSGETALATMWTIIAAAFALWSIALFVWKRQKALDLPQWTLFAVIAGLGVMGLS